MLTSMADLKLTKDADGKAFEVAEGSLITVSLPEVPTSGFRWQAETSPGEVLTADQSSFGAHGGASVGGGGVRTLQFRANQPGTSELRARLWRAWEGESSIIERFSATFKITSNSTP
jgi:inhibitor of cysteine peptidase